MTQATDTTQQTSPEPAPDGACSCWATSRNGCPVHYLEQFGTTGRAAKIAAIYAFAHWLCEHPEVPAPTDITAVWWTHAADEPDEATRIAGLTAVAEKLGDKVYGEEIKMFAHKITKKEAHGIRIDYEAAATTDHYERLRGRFA